MHTESGRAQATVPPHPQGGEEGEPGENAFGKRQNLHFCASFSMGDHITRINPSDERGGGGGEQRVARINTLLVLFRYISWLIRLL